MTATNERRTTLTRKTRETDIQIELCLDGSGQYEISTGIAFFDHMLESFAKHAAFDLQLRAQGDLSVDFHHTVEDVGIALGSALREALGDARGIRRYGFFVLPMAESRVDVSLDVSNRAYLVYKVEVANDRVRDFDVSLVEDFLYAFSQNAGIDLHVERSYGHNVHHILEGIFKGLGRALDEATTIDPRIRGALSTKGSL